MLETSGDILNLTIAFCVLIFTFFLAWGLYYVIASFRKIYRLINKVDKLVNKSTETIDILKEKLKKGGSYLNLIAETTKKVVDLAEERFKGSHQNKNTKSKTKSSSKRNTQKKQDSNK